MAAYTCSQSCVGAGTPGERGQSSVPASPSQQGCRVHLGTCCPLPWSRWFWLSQGSRGAGCGEGPGGSGCRAAAVTLAGG